MSAKSDPRTEKISPQFAARLERLDPDDKVDAIIVVNSFGGADKANRQKASRPDRRSAVHRSRQAAEQALPDIDTILKRYGGHRLADGRNALGSIPVETTAEGIKALAASKYVKVILENQSISLIQ